MQLSKLYQVDIGELINNHTTPIVHETLHENVDYTIKPSNQKQAAMPPRVIQLTSDEKKLFNLYGKLSASDKKEFLNMLELKVNEIKKPK